MIALVVAAASGIVVLALFGFDGRRKEHSDASVSPEGSGGRPVAYFEFVLMGAAAATISGLVFGSPVLAALAPVVILGGAGAFRFELSARQEQSRLAALPVVVELLAQRLRAGATPLSAVRSLTSEQRAAVTLDQVVNAVDGGTGFGEALTNSAGVPPLLAAALLAVERSGANGAVAVERLADRMRLSAAGEDSARAQSGQQLASASVLALMPPVIAVLYALSDSAAANFYLRRPAGALLLAVSFSLSGASWVWMRWILMRRVLR